MKLQKEEKVVIVLLLMALSNLTVANWALHDRPSDESAGFSAESGGGAPDLVVVEGAITGIMLTKTGGHLILRIDSTRAQIFVHRDSGARDLEERLSSGDRVRISGKRAIYNGEVEIQVQRAQDVEILRE